MVAWMPAARTVMKVAPIALEAARQLDRQLRPHVLAYQFARSVDGWVGRWTSTDGGHWLVFNAQDGRLLRAFPPLQNREVPVVERELDRSTLTHHSAMPEAKVLDAAQALRGGQKRARRRLAGRGDAGHGDHEQADAPIDVEVIEVIDIDRDDPPR